jgi:hypothetical protein
MSDEVAQDSLARKILSEKGDDIGPECGIAIWNAHQETHRAISCRIWGGFKIEVQTEK